MSTGIYISNKYSKLYFKIISNAQNRVNEGYTEKHHILPKSLGGTDEPENLVELTAREHYLCHYLLTKFTEGVHRRRMLFAFKAMNMKSKTTKGRKFNSRLYEYFKESLSKATSERLSEFWSDEANRKKQSERISRSWQNGSRDSQRAWMKENSPFKNPEIHAKTIETRTKNGTNCFVTNNPMLNEESKKKKLEFMPNMKGRTQWFNTITGEKRQTVDCPEGEGWIKRGHKYGLVTKAKGVPKPKVKCEFCGREMAPHTMSRHIKAKHGKDKKD